MKLQINCQRGKQQQRITADKHEVDHLTTFTERKFNDMSHIKAP